MGPGTKADYTKSRKKTGFTTGGGIEGGGFRTGGGIEADGSITGAKKPRQTVKRSMAADISAGRTPKPAPTVTKPRTTAPKKAPAATKKQPMFSASEAAEMERLGAVARGTKTANKMSNAGFAGTVAKNKVKVTKKTAK